MAGTLLAPVTQASQSHEGHQRDDFSICWSIYAGWMPWGYADAEGIVDKWADRYGIEIDVRQVNDYVESINQYTAGNVDGCAMTNMDALTLPAASGVDSTALIIGDYSDGNDGVLLRDSEALADIAGRHVNLVQFSVSHYLLARALESVDMSERDVTTVNSGDADIVALASNSGTEAVVTWNPQRAAVASMPGWHEVFSSREIPGEILDLMVVNTDTLAENPDFGRALVYLVQSSARLAENPSDKLLPALRTMAETFVQLASVANVRTGELVLWSDTLASLERLGWGVGISVSLALLFGLFNGSLPLARAKFSPLITVVSLIPPMAILPILFIAFGTGELAKVALIVIGITPFLIRDLQGHAMRLPAEQLIKAQTLGASSWQVMMRVQLPQMMPRLLSALRLAMGSAWLFLIAAEAIAAQDGLGYRIFLVRRYLSMEVILPYVAWITLLAFIFDQLLAQISRRIFPWYHAEEAED